MNHTHFLPLMFLASISLANCVSAQTAQSSSEKQTESRATAPSNEPIEIAAVATIFREGVGTVRAEYELGVLEAGKKYRLKLAAVNPTDASVVFDRAQVGCTCMAFEAEVKEIAARGTSLFVVTFATPSSANERGNVEYIKLMANGVEMPIGILQVKFNLSNFFDVKTDRIVIEIPDEENSVEARVAVHIEPPLTRDELELDVSRQLRDLAVELLPDGDHAIIKITATKENINMGSIAGDVYLQRRDSPHREGVALLVRRQEKLTINPDSIRLERVPDKENVYMGKAMLRSKIANPQSERPFVELQVAGKAARVEATPIGNTGIYRVDIRVDGPLEPAADGKLSVKWAIRFATVERVIESYGFLD